MAEEQALQIYWDKRMQGDKGKEEDKGRAGPGAAVAQER
jgi:hypothetical protein